MRKRREVPKFLLAVALCKNLQSEPCMFVRYSVNFIERHFWWHLLTVMGNLIEVQFLHWGINNVK